MRIILCGGGTAGHVIPLLEIARILKTKGHTIVYVGSGLPERNLVKLVPFKAIAAGKWRRYFSLANGIDFFRVIIGFVQAVWFLRQFKPDVIIAKGGYVSLPVVLAAGLLRRRLYIHESDAVAGWSNRIASRFAKKVFVGFPAAYYSGIPAGKLRHVGVPVRHEFFHKATTRDRKLFDLDKGAPVVLVTGGSQGAQGLNRLVLGSLLQLASNYQLIHIVGGTDMAAAIEARNRLPVKLQRRYHVYRQLTNEMAAAVRVADVVVSRAGSAMFELVAARKPAVIVPLPSSASNHQRKNAQYFHNEFGYLVMEQENITPSQFQQAIETARKATLHLPNFPDAGKTMVREILES